MEQAATLDVPPPSDQVEPPPAPEADAPERSRWSHAVEALQRWSLLIVFAATVAYFSFARPSTFPTWNNFTAILDQSAPLILVSVGLTLVLALREFDLSFGAVAGLSAAIAVQLMSAHGASTAVAVAVAVLAGGAVGLLNGTLVSVVGVPSFITTLAMGSVVAGLEKATADTTIFEGLEQGFLDLTRNELAGVPLGVVVAFAAAVATGAVLRLTVFGRHTVAIGDNQVAARLAGVHVRRSHLVCFMTSGLLAGLAGVLLASRAASYYPGPGQSLLLPAFAATFLSLSLGGGWRFNVLGTVVGAVFLGTITTGLTMLDQPAWVALVVQGLLLLAAVVSLAVRVRR